MIYKIEITADNGDTIKRNYFSRQSANRALNYWLKKYDLRLIPASGTIREATK